jgi:hypothetical protein
MPAHQKSLCCSGIRQKGKYVFFFFFYTKKILIYAVASVASVPQNSGIRRKGNNLLVFDLHSIRQKIKRKIRVFTSFL